MKSLTVLMDEQLKGGDSVLDAGCGRNTFLQYIKKPLRKVGLDFYEPYLLKSKAASLHNNYILADLRNLPIDSRSFDCAVAIEVIEHLTKPDGLTLIKELERVAKTTVILTTPNGFFPASPGPEDNPGESHISGWTADELRKLGFRVYGINGCRMLRQKTGILKFIPGMLYSILRRIGDRVAYYCPAFAFQLFCVKDVRVSIILTEIHGNKMYLYAHDRSVTPSLLKNGIYEKYTTEVFKSSIKADMTVVDIGANIGYFTLIAAKLVGPAGKVYAFEPEPHNYELLTKNVLINHYDNIASIPKAVSNKTGEAELFVDRINLGGHSLSEDTVLEKAGYLKIEAVTLDDFFGKTVGNLAIDVMKIDAEGAEGIILEGAEKVLKHDLKIFMEFLPRGLKNMGTDPLGLLRRLQGLGFKINIIDELNRCVRQEEPTKIIELCVTQEGGRDSVNLLLKK